MNEIKQYLNSVEHTFQQTQGKDFLFKHTRRIDKFIAQAYKEVLDEMFSEYLPMRNSIPIALVAMGSYGREQLCVYSDIDIMLVYDEVEVYNCEAILQKVVLKLFDTGLKIGHRVHRIDELLEVSKTDITIKTALLESRFIIGSSFVWTKTQNQLQLIRKDDPKKFIEEKIAEYEKRHEKHPVTVEPNLKDSQGGFRDANLVYWIGNILFGVSKIKEIGFDEADYREFRKALEYLFRVRAALHITIKRKNDILRFQDLSDVARLLKDSDSYKDKFKIVSKTLHSLNVIKRLSRIWVYELTKQFFVDPANIARIEKLSEGVYRLGDCLLAGRKQQDLAHYLKVLVQQKDYRISPRFVKRVGNAKKNRLGRYRKDIFYAKSSYAILQALIDCGQLSNVIEPMRKIMYVPQFDGYHQYSVRKHSLLTLYHLEHLEDPFLLELYDKLDADEKAMLKLVALLHDSGKGRKSDHSEIGARIFRQFATKLGMEHIEIGVRLIKVHTFMSVVAQREDIHDDTIVLKFLSEVGGRKHLDMLFLLTVADMSAVGENIYNHYIRKLLMELYERSLDLLSEEKVLDEVAKRLKVEKRLQRFEPFKQMKRALQKNILSISSNLMFQKLTLEEICSVGEIAAKTQNYWYEVDNSDHLCIKIIRAKQLNIAYLLAKLKRLNVVTMDIYKLFDNKKYFKIEFLEKVEEFELQEVNALIEQSFDMEREIQLKTPEIFRKEVFIDCEHSKTIALMKLNCKNQIGLLAHVANIFEQYGIDIISSKVNTHKNRARDLFLIEKTDKICNNIEKVLGSLCVE